MNTELNNTFVNAVLADASYVDGLAPGNTATALQDKLRPKGPKGSETFAF